ncbi:MAG: SDR family NAD(P)-dependent oxidoreductase [bacterium]|nr:SDR family NAD(P)-dependent oxidoreductase [bacterium]
MLSLAGRTAVITGAASGIGRAMALRFSAEGMAVVAADVDAAALDELAADPGWSSPVRVVPTDVSDPSSVEELAVLVFEEFGEVGVLCNNAGVGPMGTIWEVDVPEWEWVLGVNLWGVINGVRSFIPRMLESGREGHVVNTASMAGLIAGREMTRWRLGAYAASKHAVVAISHTLYAELRTAGAPIGVSLLCPAAVNTRIWDTERLRPLPGSEPSQPASQGAERLRAQLRTGLELGNTPVEVAEMVLEAVVEDRFYVFTSPGSPEQVGRHVGDLVDLRNPPVPGLD